MQNLTSFRLEEYLASREFAPKALMFSGSDLQSRSIEEVLSLANPEEKEAFFNLPLSYTTTEGSLSLRQELARLYQFIEATEIHCFAGAEEAIYIAAQVLLDAQSHAITFVPCYQSLASIAANLCETTCLPIQKTASSWELDLNRLKDAIRPNTKAIFLNIPHNPTGFVPTLETFKAIIELAREHGIWLFSDEVYRGLYWDKNYHLPAACDLYEKAISLGVLSKSFGFPGLRIGWIATKNTEILQKFSQYKHYLSICNSGPSEALAQIILKNKEKILQENNHLTAKNLTLLSTYFHEKTDLFQWYNPQGGCIAYPQYLGEENIRSLANNLLAEKNIIIIPDWVYGEDNNHFRVGFGRKNMPECLQRFAEFFSVN